MLVGGRRGACCFFPPVLLLLAVLLVPFLPHCLPVLDTLPTDGPLGRLLTPVRDLGQGRKCHSFSRLFRGGGVVTCVDMAGYS